MENKRPGSSPCQRGLSLVDCFCLGVEGRYKSPETARIDVLRYEPPRLMEPRGIVPVECSRGSKRDIPMLGLTKRSSISHGREGRAIRIRCSLTSLIDGAAVAVGCSRDIDYFFEAI